MANLGCPLIRNLRPEPAIITTQYANTQATQHPIALENYRCQSSYGSLFFPLSLNVLVYTHRMDGATDEDAWLYFPEFTKNLICRTTAD
ncbi:hypothetical protein DAPPUDRAFT_249097 [Daphnia pulex]|uniref:Uncharacterized protein n=1 Tax=Daphnia pulex TaxID=6669 RepID=E9GVU8_DAPPU|nr:hypothetical protein DAPPUDRAFT_249097 [Daphnia pulex]|eukprot:EFX76388.1 hypothetical protein DAPPUDRAFT_249097 [Daphnia pulex]